VSYISFAWTTPAVLAGAKTVTRRDWTDRHARQFHAGDVVDAWSKDPRAGGRKVARVRILSIALEPMAWMPDRDYAAEGFDYLHSLDEPGRCRHDFEHWRQSGGEQWVIRFELVEVL